MKHVLLKVGAIRKLPPCVQGWCDSSSPTFIFSKAQKKNFSREHLIECCWYIECPKGFVPDSESEIKKSLTVTHDLPNDDDAQEVEEIVALEVSPTLDGEKSSGKKKLAAKTSTTGVSKKSRAIVASVVATGSATVEDILMGEADSEPLLLTQSRVKVPTPPSLSQHPSSESRPQVLVINDSILKQQRFFREVRKFVVSCSPSRSWRIHGVPSLRGAADLVIVDLPEGLPVPTVSVPSSVVPTWNEKSEDYLQELFDFADEILYDNVSCYFFPFDNGEFFEDIKRFYDSFGFVVCKEWMEVNLLPISSARISNTTTNKFNILLLKRVSRPKDSVSWTSTFSIRYVPELVAQGVDVGLNDTLINFCTNPLMDGARPWRGPREKDEYFFSCLIMALTTVGDLVIDVAAATGMNFTSLMSLI